MATLSPLANNTILITRGANEVEAMSSLISHYGGTAMHVPLLSFQYNEDTNESTYLTRLGQYDWIIFTSKNGVDFFFQRLESYGKSLKGFKGKIAAVGDKTKEVLHTYGINVSFVPEKFTAEDFSEEFQSQLNSVKSVLIPKGNLARDVIASQLTSQKVNCDEWVIYNTVLPPESKQRLRDTLLQSTVDFITFTSSSTVRHFMQVVKEYNLERQIEGLPIACIGPIAKRTAREFGLHVNICPKVYTVEGMIEEIVQYVKKYKEEEE
jgi:uroporphyrinogen-III synthase